MGFSQNDYGTIHKLYWDPYLLLFLFLQRKNGEFDEEAVEITGQLLSANPDFYSLWNFRRQIFQHFIEEK